MIGPFLDICSIACARGTSISSALTTRRTCSYRMIGTNIVNQYVELAPQHWITSGSNGVLPISLKAGLHSHAGTPSGNSSSKNISRKTY